MNYESAMTALNLSPTILTNAIASQKSHVSQIFVFVLAKPIISIEAENNQILEQITKIQ